MAAAEGLVAPAGEGAALLEGVLKKSTAKGNTFQKRWVWLLDGGLIQYTKDVRKHDSSSAKRTTINLIDAQLVLVNDSGGKFVFRLRWDNTREYSFAADDEADFVRWHTAIAAAIPTTVTLSFVHNERFNAATGVWSADALLPSDPPRCCNERTGDLTSMATELVPDAHWQWTREWEIDRGEWDGVGADEEGWQCALDWPTTDLLARIATRGGPVPKWMATNYRFAYVRRRRYTRNRTRDGPQQTIRMEDSLHMGRAGASDGRASSQAAGASLALEARGSQEDEGDMDAPDVLVTQLAQGEVVTEGWLWKRGQYNTNHKRRWFVLKSTGLLFYKKEPALEPLGVIDLSDCCVFIAEDFKSKEDFGIGVLGSALGSFAKASKLAEVALQKYKPFAFKVVPRGQKEREFALCAEAQSEMDAWTECINSTIPAIAVVEIWQNERWDHASQRWGPLRLIEAERPEWSDEAGDPKAIDDELLPKGHITWFWLGPWTVDMGIGLARRCDPTEGWEYAINWPNPLLPGVEWDAVCSVTSLVRRRRWARRRERLEPEQITKTFTAVMHHSASPSAMRLNDAGAAARESADVEANPIPQGQSSAGSKPVARASSATNMYVIQTTIDGTVMIKSAEAAAERAILEQAELAAPEQAALATAGAGAEAAEPQELLDGSVSPRIEEGLPPPLTDGAMPEGMKSSYEISRYEDIVIGKFIAKGSSGSVHRGQWEGMECAVKIFDYRYGLGLSNEDQQALQQQQQHIVNAFRTEAILLRNLNHQNLVRLYAVCSTPPHLCILTELMTSSLDNLLYGKGSKNEITERRIVRISHGIANGMAFLHRNGVCHRDLKSPNVLYDRDLNIKLCDFAFSKFKDGMDRVNAQMDSRVGTPAWMAPEVLCGEPYSHKADVYSFGVIFWEILHRCRPFQDLNAWAIAYQVGMQGRRLPIPYENPKTEGTVPGVVAYMITQCWKPEKHRPTFENILDMLKPMQQAVADEKTLHSVAVSASWSLATAGPEPEMEPETETEPDPEAEPEPEPEAEEEAQEEQEEEEVLAAPQLLAVPQRAPPALDTDGFAGLPLPALSLPALGLHAQGQLRAPPALELEQEVEQVVATAVAATPSPSQPIHYAVDEVHYLAETVDEFIELLTEAAVDEETLVWQEGMSDWEALGQCREVRQTLGLVSDHEYDEAEAEGEGEPQPQPQPVVTAGGQEGGGGGGNYDF